MTKFEQLVEQIKEHPAEWLMDGEGFTVLNELLDCAPANFLEKIAKNIPQKLREEIEAKLLETELFRKVEFVDDDGEPVFTLRQITENLGMPAREALRKLKELGEVPYKGSTHRIH